MTVKENICQQPVQSLSMTEAIVSASFSQLPLPIYELTDSLGSDLMLHCPHLNEAPAYMTVLKTEAVHYMEMKVNTQ